jgi:anti-sigma regulatory factor (Ser/Thr protein kinase)
MRQAITGSSTKPTSSRRSLDLPLRAVDQHGQIIDALVSEHRDGAAARALFCRALRSGPGPVEVTTDRAPVYPRHRRRAAQGAACPRPVCEQHRGSRSRPAQSQAAADARDARHRGRARLPTEPAPQPLRTNRRPARTQSKSLARSPSSPTTSDRSSQAAAGDPLPSIDQRNSAPAPMRSATSKVAQAWTPFSAVMCWRLEEQLPADATAPHVARARVAAALTTTLSGADGHRVLDDAVLVVSELVTNAVRAGSDTVTVSASLHHGKLELEVTDGAFGWPLWRQASDISSIDGRGLIVVKAVAAAWGVISVPTGKSVWAMLRVRADLTLSLDCHQPVSIFSDQVSEVRDLPIRSRQRYSAWTADPAAS